MSQERSEWRLDSALTHAHTHDFPPRYFPHFGLFPAIFQGMVAPPIDHVPPGVLPDQHIMFPVFIERFESISPDNLLVFVALLCKVKYSILIGDHFRLSVTNPDSTEGVAREHLGAPWVHSGCTKGAHKVHQGALRVHVRCIRGASGCTQGALRVHLGCIRVHWGAKVQTSSAPQCTQVPPSHINNCVVRG